MRYKVERFGTLEMYNYIRSSTYYASLTVKKWSQY